MNKQQQHLQKYPHNFIKYIKIVKSNTHELFFHFYKIFYTCQYHAVLLSTRIVQSSIKILEEYKPEKKKKAKRENYPSRPGFVGQYTFLKPDLFAAKAVVSPIQATALPHRSDSERRLTQALFQQKCISVLNKTIPPEILGKSRHPNGQEQQCSLKLYPFQKNIQNLHLHGGWHQTKIVKCTNV